MDRVPIGIVGVGQIGKHHLREYAQIPGAEVIAVADINADEARRVSAEFHVAHVYTNFRDLLRRDDIAAVDVCLHNNLHAPATLAALRAGKHVYCEKPMAGSYTDAKAMYDAARECGRKLSVQLSTLFSVETKAAKRLIEQGKLGKLYHARSIGYRRRGRPFVDGYGTAMFVKKEVAAGGALFDMGVYHIAQMLYLLGIPPVERISGKIYQETDMDAARRASSGYNVEELGVGFVRFAGGATLDILEAWAIHMSPFEGSFVVGTAGGVRLEPFGYHSTTCDMDMDSTTNLKATDQRWHRLLDTADAYDSPQRHWIAALQGRVDLLPCAELGLQTMLVSEGIYLSNRLGREVTGDEVVSMSRSTALPL